MCAQAVEFWIDLQAMHQKIMVLAISLLEKLQRLVCLPSHRTSVRQNQRVFGPLADSIEPLVPESRLALLMKNSFQVRNPSFIRTIKSTIRSVQPLFDFLICAVSPQHRPSKLPV